MGERSSIAWTEASWNFIRGCRRVSEGCDRCYAIGVAHRFGAGGRNPVFAGLTRETGRGRLDWMGFARFYPQHLELPLRWGEPRRIFVNSLSDLYHESIPDDQIAQGYAVMALAARHTFQILTKRPARMAALLGSPAFWALVAKHHERIALRRGLPGAQLPQARPLPNVWHGVSVETQRWADARIPPLLACPSAVRFLSCEPLLGHIELDAHLWAPGGDTRVPAPPGLDWVIVGGESGAGARALEEAWARSLLAQCRVAHIACFVKQLGSVWARQQGAAGKGEDPGQWPEWLRVREYPGERSEG